ncbi:MAG: FtsH protease activity modulator HflK [Desulfobacteraceae bacterium]|nr:FtsH protease activity modulator HflK [Desulfobacteraceae bacterium]
MNWDWEKLQQRQKERSRTNGSGTGGSGPRPPQVDDIINKFKNFKFSGIWILIIVALLVLLAGSTMVYTVQTNEVGVIQRFGEFSKTTQSGLHFKLPAGIEKVTKVKTKRVYTEEFGLKADELSDSRSFGVSNDEIEVAMMLTGDLNVGLVPWIVQYRIKDPYNYLFKVADVRQLIRDMAEASMRLVVGDRSINEVISKRQEIAVAASVRLQKDLNEAETGIEIVTVELGNTNVPEPVQDSFNEVNRAVQQKEEVIYNARKDYNQVIPSARGQAEKTIETAKGYAINRINRAEGDAARFLSRYEAYMEAKDVTRRRLYLEMMENVLPKLGNKYVVDSQQDNLLPLLNLGLKKGVPNAGQ